MLVGALIGAMVGALLAKFGRRLVLTIGDAIYIIGVSLCLFGIY